MPDWREIQREMAAHLTCPRPSAAAGALFAGDEQRIGRGLAVYRANMQVSAAKALEGAYPVIAQVVGAEFFDATAREFRLECPPRSGDLNEYGAEFAAFLAGFAPVRSLPYLPDLARLEWQVHVAEGAADAPAWDASALGDVAPQRQEAIRFAWAPGTALVASRFPIVRVWSLHQPGLTGDFDVDWSVAQDALVAREGDAVAVQALAAGEAAFVTSMLAGAALCEATLAAFAADAAFDLAGLLSRAVASRLICGYTLEGT